MMLYPALALVEEAAPITLYVDPAGDDAAEGALEAPLQTLAEAAARLRKLKSVKGEATIWLRGGVYRLEETLALDYRDRGNVAFRAYPGETPILTGDTPITEWTETTLHGQTVWAAPLQRKAVRALYGEDGARPNARWPKEGMLAVERPVNVVKSMFINQRAFYVTPANLPESLEGAFVRLLHWWKDELSGVQRYDPSTGRLTLNRSTSLTIREGDRYWLENVLTVPMLPGEWAYDAQAALLYYAPQAGETPDGTPLYVGTVERLLSFDGLSGITLAGITFARTAWNIPLRDSQTDFAQAAFDAECTVFFRNGKNITIEGCTFRDIGAGCIRLDAGVKDAAIRDCTFAEIGAQAVYVKGRNVAGDTTTTERLTIEGNRISGYGRNFLKATAILLIHAREVDVRQNEIHDGTYTAISAGWVWGTGYNVTDHIRIQGNHLYDIGQGMLADMGAIYTLGVQRNTVISGNLIHDVQASEYGGWGIYLDEGASGITVENNLVFRCSSQAFHQHNGVHTTVRNNIFAFCGEGQVGMSDRRSRSGTFHLEDNLLIGEEPFFWLKEGKGKIDLGENLLVTGVSSDVDLESFAAVLLQDPAYAGTGFIPFTLTDLP